MPRALLVLLPCLLLAACGRADADVRLATEGPPELAALAVRAERPAAGDTLAARAAYQTDKAGATYYDALAAPQDDPAMGFSVGGYRMLDGWRWWLGADSLALDPADRVRGVARPDVTLRAYARQDTLGWTERLLGMLQRGRTPRLTERVTLLDGQGALLVEVPDSLGAVAFRPVVSDRPEVGNYQVEVRGGTLLIARDNYGARAEGEYRPVWTAVRAEGSSAEGEARRGLPEATPEGGRDRALVPGEVLFSTPGRVVVVTADTPEEADARARRALRDAGRLRDSRAARMAALLRATPLDTADDAFDAAFAWAVLGLDALTHEDSARARLAPGLPGTAPYTAVSTLHGFRAWLGMGRFETARALLMAFGDAQLFDRRIDVLGRAPDAVPPAARPVYATTDATPRYLAAAGDYVRATGDRGLVSGGPNFWFKSVFALRGLYEPDTRRGTPVTPEGFLTARQAYGSWADTEAAARVGVPVEAQGALFRALRATYDFAGIMGVQGRDSGRWYADSADALQRATLRRYVTRDSLVVDRFGLDGLPAQEPRAHALLALADLNLPARQRAALTRRLAGRVAFPHGAATLSQADSAFHPFLRNEAYYPPEAARFNGTVWTWMTGPLTTLMAQSGGVAPAAELAQNQARLLLDRGLVGGLPETLDGHPRAEGAPAIGGGAPLSALGLATFVQSVYEGFLGLSYAGPGEVVLAPALPEAWGETRTRVRVGDGYVGLVLRQRAGTLEADLTPEGLFAEGAVLRLRSGGREVSIPLGAEGAAQEGPVRVRVGPEGATLGGAAAEAETYAAADPAWWDGFAFAEPELRRTYPVMAAIRERQQLGPEQILRDNPLAQIVLTQTDPDGDDWGATSTFTYPLGFPEGVLDATYFEIARDDSTTYFRAEFTHLIPRDTLGFPPTMLAIVLDTGPGGTRRVGRGADYEFPAGGGYEYVIFIGDGLVAEDARGRVIGELPPGSSVFAYETGSMTFALPTFVLPRLARGTRAFLLVGARTGGGGLGEFRRVERTATEAVGGGRVDRRAANVYDVVAGTVSQ